MIIVPYILYPKYVTGREAEAIDVNVEYTTIPFDSRSKYANIFCNNQKLDPCCITFTGSVSLHCCCIMSTDFSDGYKFNFKLELGYSDEEPSVIHEWKTIVNKELISTAIALKGKYHYIKDENIRIVYLEK